MITRTQLIDTIKEQFKEELGGRTPNDAELYQILGLHPESRGYELNFLGKSTAQALYRSEPFTELQQDTERSINADTTGNLIIRGDNLDALKLLQDEYAGKVKMIYIDPPYNTKKGDFTYPDNFRKDYKLLLKNEGLEASTNFTNEKATRAHSGWLAFMLPRLKLARDLLREDGVIFMSIDDNEQHNLRVLCDEIFGEENFVSNIAWLKGNAQSDVATIQSNHEHIVCYAKNKSTESIHRVALKMQVTAEYDKLQKKHFYEGGKINRGGTLQASIHQGYTLYYNPETQDIQPRMDYDKELAKNSNDESQVYTDDASLIDNGYIPVRPPKKHGNLGSWTWSFTKANFSVNSLLIKQKGEDWEVFKKEWLEPRQVKKDEQGNTYAIVDKTYPPKSVIDFVGSAQGSINLQKLFKYYAFTHPKPVNLVKHLINISTQSADDIVLDFFAGSGTTGHACLELNADDITEGKEGTRKFILVQLNEEIQPDSALATYELCKKELGVETPTIADVTIERVKRAGEVAVKLTGQYPRKKIDSGFKVFNIVEKEAQTE